MTKKKVLAISAVLGIFALVLSAGTMAYFTDRTDAKENTFTVGKVDIELTEPEINDWGLDENNNAKTKLMPGRSYSKTPTITVASDSETAYVFADIQLSNAMDYVRAVANLLATESKPAEQWMAEFEAGNFSNNAMAGAIRLILSQEDGFITGYDKNAWEIIAFNIDKNADSADIIIAHKEAMEAEEEVKIFTGINIPKELPNEVFEETDFTNAKITIMAAAIQAEGFDDYKKAGNALACQWNMASALGVTCE